MRAGAARPDAGPDCRQRHDRERVEADRTGLWHFRQPLCHDAADGTLLWKKHYTYTSGAKGFELPPEMPPIMGARRRQP